MELYFKIKLVETIVGYVIIALMIIGLLVFLFFTFLGDKWDERQKRKSDKFWKNH